MILTLSSNSSLTPQKLDKEKKNRCRADCCYQSTLMSQNHAVSLISWFGCASWEERVRRSGSKIEREDKGQEVRLPESSGLTNKMKMFRSLLNCRATAALAQTCVSMCIYVHSVQASPHCMSGWLPSVYSSLPPVALCTSLPPLR